MAALDFEKGHNHQQVPYPTEKGWMEIRLFLWEIDFALWIVSSVDITETKLKNRQNPQKYLWKVQFLVKLQAVILQLYLK